MNWHFYIVNRNSGAEGADFFLILGSFYEFFPPPPLFRNILKQGGVFPLSQKWRIFRAAGAIFLVQSAARRSENAKNEVFKARRRRKKWDLGHFWTILGGVLQLYPPLFVPICNKGGGGITTGIKLQPISLSFINT